ncbi:MAG: hypothetical protein LC774_13790 [Acidobacteria bacterium]|nr:hypothetical protein [Acidobacteriota bacterium]
MITSRQNPLAQRFRAVREGRDDELIFVEGVRLCAEAARSALLIEAVLFTDKMASEGRGAPLLERLGRGGARLTQVSESVLDSVADTRTPQGIVLLARRPRCDRETFESALGVEPLLVVLHGVSNPSNSGAMLRVAEAAGAAALRGCAAAQLRVKIDGSAPENTRQVSGLPFPLFNFRRLPLE